MYLKDILDVFKYTRQVSIIMSDFDDVTTKQEEIDALMNEGFGNDPISQASSTPTSTDDQHARDIPDLTLSNSLRVPWNLLFPIAM